MYWNKIATEQALDEVISESSSAPVLIFKHSPRCSISSVALSRLEKSWEISSEMIKPFLVDVIHERAISNLIAEKTGIRHESPQVLVIFHGKCIYSASHLAITYSEIEMQAKKAA